MSPGLCRAVFVPGSEGRGRGGWQQVPGTAQPWQITLYQNPGSWEQEQEVSVRLNPLPSSLDVSRPRAASCCSPPFVPGEKCRGRAGLWPLPPPHLGPSQPELSCISPHKRPCPRHGVPAWHRAQHPCRIPATDWCRGAFKRSKNTQRGKWGAKMAEIQRNQRHN